MTNPTGQTGVEGLKQQILKAGNVRFASGAFTQKHYSNGTVSPIEHKVQEIVEIGIDDLMHLVQAHTSAVLDRVEKGMPKKRPVKPYDPDMDITKAAWADITNMNSGFNQAVDQFTDLMKKVREEI